MAAHDEADRRVTEALRFTDEGEKAHASYTRDYDRSYDVYRATAKARASRGKSKHPWESDIRIPYGQQVVDTAMVNIIGGRPRAKVKPRRPGDEAAAKSMGIMLDYHVAEDHLAEKQPVFVQQSLIYSVTAAKNHWLYRTSQKRSRRFESDPFGGQPQAVQTVEEVVLRDGPTFEPWDVYDLWWDPKGRDVDSCRYVVLRSWLGKEELLALARTEDNPFGLYDNVEEVLRAASEKQGVRTSSQERFIGGGYDKRKDTHEILEIWTDDELVVVGNRKVLMRHEPNPYHHGQKPVVITNTRPDLFEIKGMSETELLDHLQQSLWTLMNARFDNLHMTVQRGFTYREAGIIDPNVLDFKPRFKWPVTDHDDIRPVDMPSLPPEVYREDDTLLARMQLVTGINPYVSGADLNSVDQNTATGVTALQEVASRLLRFKARQLAYRGYQRTFEQWGELIKQFMTEEQAIRIEGPTGGYQWGKIAPWQVAGSFEYFVEGTEESLSRQQERAEAMALLNAFAPFAQWPGVTIGPVLERIATAYDMPEGSLYNPQAAQQPPAAPMPGNGGQPPQAQSQQGPQAALPQALTQMLTQRNGGR